MDFSPRLNPEGSGVRPPTVPLLPARPPLETVRTLRTVAFPRNPMTSSPCQALSQLPPEIVHAVTQALQTLSRARRYAHDLSCDEWVFAVEIDRLLALGLATCDLRWLLGRGWVSTAIEETEAGSPVRTFKDKSAALLTPRSCFVVTAAGERVLAEDPAPSLATIPMATTAAKPAWDPTHRRLTMGECVVKHYRVPAANQERVLTCFAEDNWPERIDDPLPPVASLDPKRRLQSTIMCLNRNQRHRLIRFRGDGSGRGVLWEPFGATG